MSTVNTAFEITSEDNLPDTGIGGVYEVVLTVEDVEFAKKYFEEFGFSEISTADFSAKEAMELYGHHSNLKSYRLQNHNIDSHGLIRIISWENPINKGIGLVPPRSIGQRIAVMHCSDIFRLKDVLENASDNNLNWNITEPVSDDLFDLDGGEKSFFKRPVIVRENAAYGNFFNHIFFQRYGYHIEGYGTINKETPLATSEFTHHDFFVNCKDLEDMKYLSTALGLKAEEPPKIDSETQKGPKAVFQMQKGESHWYQGFVSPNNICGKLKIFIPLEDTRDCSDKQKVGSIGMTLHSFCVKKLKYVRSLIEKEGLSPTTIFENEFGEHCFNFTGSGGCSWQIIEKSDFVNEPIKNLEFTLTKN